MKTAFKDLMESESFITYSKLENPTINQDREIIIFFFKEIIAVSEVFYEYMEDHELTWIDDLPVVNTHTLKMLNKIDPSDFNSLNFPKMSPSEEDPQFALELLEKVVVKNDELAVFVLPKDLGQFDSYCDHTVNLDDLQRMVSIDFFPGRGMQSSSKLLTQLNCVK